MEMDSNSKSRSKRQLEPEYLESTDDNKKLKSDPQSQSKKDDDEIETDESQLKLETLAEKGSKVMGNSIVLTRIAKMLPAVTLLDLRETCQMWNQFFIPQLREVHKPIRLASHTNTGTDDEDKDKQNRHGFVSYMKVMQESENLPFCRYDVRPIYRPQEEEANSQLARNGFTDFLTKFQTSIKYLEIEWGKDGDPSTPQLRKLIFDQIPELEVLKLRAVGVNHASEEDMEDPTQQLVKVLPKLKGIKISKPAGMNQAVTQMLADVIENAPHLRSIKLNGYVKTRPCAVSTLLAGLRSSYHASQLKTLRLANASVTGLECLTDLGQNYGLRLQDLQLNLHSAFFEDPEQAAAAAAAHQFHAFFLTQASSLTHLHMDIVARSGRQQQPPQGILEETPFRIPRLERVDTFTLHLKGNVLGLVRLGFANTFEESFPSLQRYNQRHENMKGPISENFAAAMSQISHPRVEELSMRSISRTQLCSLALRFPAVNSFSVKFSLEDARDYFWPGGKFRRNPVAQLKKQCWAQWPSLISLNGQRNPKLERKRKKKLAGSFYDRPIWAIKSYQFTIPELVNFSW